MLKIEIVPCYILYVLLHTELEFSLGVESFKENRLMEEHVNEVRITSSSSMKLTRYDILDESIQIQYLFQQGHLCPACLRCAGIRPGLVAFVFASKEIAIRAKKKPVNGKALGNRGFKLNINGGGSMIPVKIGWAVGGPLPAPRDRGTDQGCFRFNGNAPAFGKQTVREIDPMGEMGDGGSGHIHGRPGEKDIVISPGENGLFG